MRKKKKFFETGVGRVLKGVASIAAPGLVGALESATTVGEAIQVIKTSTEIDDETKIKLQELALDQYNAEVQDRMSARSREAQIAAAGGTDILFKTVGWGIVLAFLLIVLYAIGIIPQQPDLNHDYLMFASGSVTTAFMAVVSYYFGSSMGSKQKSAIMSGK